MSTLWVGNIDRNWRLDEIEHEFLKYGQCTVKTKDDNDKWFPFVYISYTSNIEADRAKRCFESKKN